MNEAIRSVSLWDNLIYNLSYVIPMALQGGFTRNHFWVGFFARVHPDPAGVRFVSRLRRKYKSEYLWVRLLGTRSLLVLDPQGVNHVLENSPLIYADGRPKREGMRLFQPNAVTISRGDDWRERRHFNEAVLNSGQPIHQCAEQILQIVRDEVNQAAGSKPLHWQDFDRLFERITLQVIFGRSARSDRAITGLLGRMLREANRPVRPKKSKYFDPFYARVRAYLEAAQPGSLAAVCRELPSTQQTRVENQVPHWMFAMWETLGANTVRALAAILAHPWAEERVRREMAGSDLETPRGIDQLKYVEACLQEAMRLWSTTPVLVRETLVQDRLGGATIPPATQVLIWNSFNHRDHERYPLADTFSPEAWESGRPNPLLNHLSSGPQICAGVDLLLFIAKAVVATLLNQHRYVLVRPALRPDRPMPYAYNYFEVVFG
jgi:cytochrome P450